MSKSPPPPPSSPPPPPPRPVHRLPVYCLLSPSTRATGRTSSPPRPLRLVVLPQLPLYRRLARPECLPTPCSAPRRARRPLTQTLGRTSRLPAGYWATLADSTVLMPGWILHLLNLLAASPPSGLVVRFILWVMVLGLSPGSEFGHTQQPSTSTLNLNPQHSFQFPKFCPSPGIQ
jgi:hypothetical protein